MHTLTRAAGFVLVPLALALGAGCNPLSPLVERRATFELAPAGEAPLEARTVNGAIKVSEGTDQKIVVHAVIRARTQERADATTVIATSDSNGSFVISPQWPGERMTNEGCSLEIVTPDVSSIALVTSNGAITLGGLSGSARLSTSNGAIKVDGFTGAVDASTSNGSVTIVGATHGVSARSSNGNLKVTMADTSPGPVVLSTSNGSIELSVGSAFTGSLSATTSNGTVGISAPNAKDIVTSRAKGSARFGDGDGTSVLKSSNGSISVRGR
ncbi:MAG: DUF4097 family beta strand repeat protein [Phycisphaeraceae bacterium]|nr:DUF4097 family beta strand repeat protein [Phycisphaeraceae bacterium]